MVPPDPLTDLWEWLELTRLLQTRKQDECGSFVFKSLYLLALTRLLCADCEQPRLVADFSKRVRCIAPIGCRPPRRLGFESITQYVGVSAHIPRCLLATSMAQVMDAAEASKQTEISTSYLLFFVAISAEGRNTWRL